MKSSILALVATATTALAEFKPSIAGASWGLDRIDLFGVDSEENVWHKFYTKYGWEPNNDAGNLERFSKASAGTPPSVASWGSGHLNYVFVDTSNTTRHKYWTGSEWQPSGSSFEDLGKGPVGKPSLNSWGENRLDIVGISSEGSCLHKAWTGSSWYPGVKDWEDLGGNFTSDPISVSWGANRLDIFGITNEGNVSHKYWNGASWVPDGKDWEDLGGAGFSGSLGVSSMSAGRVDVWAAGKKDGALYHLYWDAFAGVWQGWESLGGEGLTNAPQVTHWGPNRIDILGRQSSKAGEYVYKYWDGGQWSDWYKKVGAFASEPAMVSLAANNLNLFGIDKDGKVLLEVWDGSQWLPSWDAWYTLADTAAEVPSQLLATQTPISRVFRHAGKGFGGEEMQVEVEL